MPQRANEVIESALQKPVCPPYLTVRGPLSTSETTAFPTRRGPSRRGKNRGIHVDFSPPLSLCFELRLSESNNNSGLQANCFTEK